MDKPQYSAAMESDWKVFSSDGLDRRILIA